MTRSKQGELWSADPSGWAERAEIRNRPLHEAVLDRLDLEAGERLLDVGCGTGQLCALAVERGAEAVGVDAASGLLVEARRRVPLATFVEGDLERLAFETGSFLKVAAVNVLPYADDRPSAVAELVRVLAPGGRVAATVGASPDEQECAALVDPLAPPSEVPDWQAGVDLREPGAMARLLRGAGLSILDDGWIRFDHHYADVAEAVAAQLPAGPVQAAIRHSGREAVVDALGTFFARRLRGDGSVVQPVAYRCVVAAKPPSR